VREAGLQSRVEIRLQDYRDVDDGPYDKISSIGMFEHVGLKNLPRYFRIIRDLLRDGGVALNHGITATDVDNRSVGRGAGEFIDRYVFPDGELPHVSLAIRELSAAGLEVVDAESLRRHYALTCEHWSRRFEYALPALRAAASERQIRIWRIYLAGCAMGFAKRWMNIYQLLAVKSGAETAGLPLTRDYMYDR
jgi:cyclopropane-fatty-acyl-phospholipid synthase